ncbi:hypothetical protein B0H66DRAFT_534111 [Apodospora peruviana]|uniref:FAD-binding domain-containing protein n=1 Tax=Apodospora peruviana TaxID=516989 RepID=A0AAE0M1N8_9PEZI|nr:hypothetical protein B0H66DRAFT_534111 [Apodospora peruviana]
MVALQSLCILIVGTGPVGLTAATALAQEGHDVKVLERHPDLHTNDGTIVIQTPAARALNEMGLDEKLRSIIVPNSFNFWSYKDSSKPMVIDIQAAWIRHAWPTPTVRRSLQRMVYETARCGWSK